MAARLIQETDVIEVANPPVLIYGQPGAGKTSLAQTAPNPITFDFDAGAHRSAFRKTVLRFDSWEDLVEVQRDGLKTSGALQVQPGFANFDTIVIDTIGSLLKSMARALAAADTKNRKRDGSLSIQGYGAMKDCFDQWVDALKAANKQVVLIAHEKEEKDGENWTKRPDIVGGSYGIVMQAADQVGYLSYRNNKRYISWDPCDNYFAKNGAQLQSGNVPDFREQPAFLAGLLAQAKANLGHTAAASANAARLVDEWAAWLKGDPSIDEVNAKLPEVSKLQNGLRNQVVTLIRDGMNAAGYEYDKKAKKYVVKEGAAA